MSDEVLCRAHDVVWRVTATDVVVFSRAARELLRLSGTGVALWDATATPVSWTQLVQQLALRFGVEADVVDRDLRPAVAELVRHGVITSSGTQAVERSA